ncbi:hypothetical protein EJ110_NYTH41503 [Nymphaea thermarum]|nr:hypothetical protein EJ110_NYTH41503 [Nymphaea thermarum]
MELPAGSISFASVGKCLYERWKGREGDDVVAIEPSFRQHILPFHLRPLPSTGCVRHHRQVEDHPRIGPRPFFVGLQHGVHDYQFARLLWNRFPALLQYPQAVLIIPVMQNPLPTLLITHLHEDGIGLGNLTEHVTTHMGDALIVWCSFHNIGEVQVDPRDVWIRLDDRADCSSDPAADVYKGAELPEPVCVFVYDGLGHDLGVAGHGGVE